MTIKDIFKTVFSFKYISIIVVCIIFIRFFSDVFAGFLYGFSIAVFLMIMFIDELGKEEK